MDKRLRDSWDRFWQGQTQWSPSEAFFVAKRKMQLPKARPFLLRPMRELRVQDCSVTNGKEFHCRLRDSFVTRPRTLCSHSVRSFKSSWRRLKMKNQTNVEKRMDHETLWTLSARRPALRGVAPKSMKKINFFFLHRHCKFRVARGAASPTPCLARAASWVCSRVPRIFPFSPPTAPHPQSPLTAHYNH